MRIHSTTRQLSVFHHIRRMTEVAIHLPDELSQFVNDSVKSGDYRTTDEFFVNVLSIYREQIETARTEVEQSRIENLRRDIQLAVDQLERGEGIGERDWNAKLAERHSAYNARHPA